MGNAKGWVLSREDIPSHQNDLGNALARQGKFDEAEPHYRRALVLDPNNFDALNNLANILKTRGRRDEAIVCYTQATAIKPDFAMAHNNLGITLRELGKTEDAAACHRHAIALDPNYAEAYYNLGNALLDLRKFDEAVTNYQRAISLKPDYAEVNINLGNAFRHTGKPGDAITSYRRAIDIRPDYVEAHHNLGNALLEQDKFEDAITCFRHAITLRPDHIEAHVNLGNALRSLGKYDEALESYRNAIAGRPDYADAHANEALTLLLTGDFIPGWRKYEWRWRTKQLKPHGLTKPLWDGGSLQGKTILLHSEQGLGDSIQFIRYASLVKEKGGQVWLSCPSPLSRLFASAAGIDRIFPDGVGIPDYDCHAPLLSLPMLFNTESATIPQSVPYLSAQQDQTSIWAQRIQPFAGLKIGLVWAGNPRTDQPNAHAIDRRRSMWLDQFAPLAMDGIHFFSLQKGPPAGQLQSKPPEMEIADFMNESMDFADTAALIANLDLVIGVDTSVIHLAGAMGKPVWVLSRFDGCWRWLLNRTDSPWYPAMRLFRQAKSGDWASVVEDVQAALKERLRNQAREDIMGPEK